MHFMKLSSSFLLVSIIFFYAVEKMKWRPYLEIYSRVYICRSDWCGLGHP